MEDSDIARTAASAAKAANSFANIPYAGPVLDLASMLADPSMRSFANFFRSVITNPSLINAVSSTLPSASTGAAATASSAASAGTGAASGLAASAAALPFMMFMGGGPLNLVLPDSEPSERVIKRAKRTRDAQSLANEVISPFTKPGMTFDQILAMPVGGSTVGNALSSILNFNLGGGWFTDTSHGWRPNPAFLGLQRNLHSRGYPGTRVENGSIVKREPTLGDVGGVGEMVLGSGFKMRNPKTAGRYNELTQGGFKFTPQQADNQLFDEHARGGESPYHYGSQAWDTFIRSISGTMDAPSVFGFNPQAVQPLEPGFDGVNNFKIDPRVYERYGDSMPAPHNLVNAGLTFPDATYDDYLKTVDAVLPESAKRLRSYDLVMDAEAENRRWIAGGGGAG